VSTAPAETGLFLEGLRCAGCVSRVERELRQLPGVERAAVNYTTHRALVRFDPAELDVPTLVERVRGLGYAAIPYDPEALERPGQRDARRALVRVLVAAFLAMNVMVAAVALYLGSYEGISPEVRRGLRWLAVGLSLPAVTWCAAPFWQGAWEGLRRGRISIDVPIALGIGTAFAVNVAGTLAESEHLYVDSAATIVFLILLGRTLERGARARAAGAVERLTALTPVTARRRGADGLEEVPAAELRVGDRVLVAPGETVPADGRIAGGATELDESLLTGESRPVLRREGDAVTGGTRNALAQIEVEVTAPVDAGTLARLAALLERAQAERPQVQRLADRVAGVFAPSVLAVAFATAAFWALSGAPWLEVALTASAVLIVACPCALALATPAAVTAALGRAARLGVLVKSGESLERCAALDAAVLDKTGTLTQGHFAVEEVAAAPGVAPEAVLARAAAAEGASSHPVARALAAAAAVRGLPVPEAAVHRVLPGRGVEAELADGTRLAVGSRELLDAGGVHPPAELQRAAAKLAERGSTLAWVAEGGRALGVVALVDPLREDAAAAVSRLERLGVAVRLVTGDHGGAARRAARAAGIADVASGVSPEQKVEAVRALRAAGARPGVVGDGINDAAALAAAEVGVAMAEGADVTLHAADVVIRAPRLGAVADLVELSRAALRRIRENLGFAVLYNAVAVPLAVAGLLHPLHAALAMSLSSVVVTANAIRLLRWKART